MPSSTDLASSQHTKKYWPVKQQAATAFLSNIDVVAQ